MTEPVLKTEEGEITANDIGVNDKPSLISQVEEQPDTMEVLNQAEMDFFKSLGCNESVIGDLVTLKTLVHGNSGNIWCDRYKENVGFDLKGFFSSMPEEISDCFNSAIGKMVMKMTTESE